MLLNDFRTQRLKDAVSHAQADVLVASLPENVFYASNGFLGTAMDSLLNNECYVVYAPATDRRIYVVSYGDMPTMLEYAGKDAELVCFGTFRFNCCAPNYVMAEQCERSTRTCQSNAGEALLYAIAMTQNHVGQVAIDAGKMSASVYNRLYAELGDSRISDGTDIFLAARRIKHPDEIVAISKSAAIAEDAMNQAFAEFSIGMTEKDIQRCYERNLANAGADKLFCVVSAGERAAFSDTINTNIPIERGMMLRVDFGCRYEGYSSDLARTAVVGEPDKKVIQYYDALWHGVKNGIAAMKPGARIGDVFQTTVNTVMDSGISCYARHHVGHGIGLEAYEPPAICASSHEIVENNMTFCLETPYYELGWGGLQIEHTIAISGDKVIRCDEGDGKLIVL